MRPYIKAIPSREIWVVVAKGEYYGEYKSRHAALIGLNELRIEKRKEKKQRRKSQL